MLNMAQRCGNERNGKEGRGGKERDGERADDIPLDSTCVSRGLWTELRPIKEFDLINPIIMGGDP